MDTTLDVLFEALEAALAFRLISEEQYEDARNYLNKLKG